MTIEHVARSPEEGRLQALRRYAVLDTAPEPAYDRVVRLASRFFHVPMAIISFVDAQRQWFKARVGVDLAETPRAVAFCNITIEARQLCLIPDAASDQRLADNPYVLGAPHLRFYAGVPLMTPDGHAVGSLSVMDTAPRADLSEEERKVLHDLAAIVIDELELRRERMDRDREARHAALRGRLVEATAGTGSFRVAVNGAMTAVREATGAVLCLLHRLAPDRQNLQVVGGQGRDGLVDDRYLTLLRGVGMTLKDSMSGRAIETGEQLVFPRVDPDILARYPGMRLNASHGCAIQIITPITTGDEKYAMVVGLEAGSAVEPAVELLQEAASAMRPLLRRLRDLEEAEIFRRAAEASDDAVIIGGSDHESELGPTIRYVNEAFLAQTGYSREQIIGQRTSILAPADPQPDFNRRVEEELKAGRIVHRDVRNRRRDGSVFWAELTITPLFDNTGWFTYWVAIRRDLTERLRAQTEARELADDLRATFESIDDGFCTLDRDWRFTYVNAKAEAMLRRPLAELTGGEVWAIWPDLAQSDLSQRLHRVAETRTTERFSYYHARFDAWFTVAAYPSRGGITIWFRDVTEDHRREEQLEQQAQMLAQARDAILMRDMDHRVTYWNRSAERLYGWTREEAMGRSVLERVSPDMERFQAAMEQLLREGYWEGQSETTRKSGETLIVDTVWTLLRHEDGTPRAVLVVDSDVTEQRALEGRLRQALRMEAVGQLTGGIAHDFNNLLTVILGNAELIMDSLGGGTELGDLAGSVVSAAERGAELTRRLLAFSRRQRLDPKSVEVNGLLSGLVQMLQRTLGGAVELVITPAPDLWNALIDAPQLENAVLNLCINARDAMGGSGRVVIETANVTFDGEAARTFDVQPGDYVLVAVSDSGAGMSPEVMARAFEPFFTTKEVGAGSGLGLSMVYGFVKQSNGQVRIYSEVGVGTSVKIYIPRAAGRELPTARPTDMEVLPGGTEHILLAEDDALVRQHAVRQLRDLGYRVTLARDGAEALTALRHHRPGEIDLLFTDVVMPGGLNGRELAVQALALHPGLPVLYTSGYTENAIMREGRLEPGVLLLQKPYRRRELAAKIRAALDRRPS